MDNQEMKMSQFEIELLQHELFLRGVDMPKSVYHMGYDKALSICLDMWSGFTYQQAIVAYARRNL